MTRKKQNLCLRFHPRLEKNDRGGLKEQGKKWTKWLSFALTESSSFTYLVTCSYAKKKKKEREILGMPFYKTPFLLPSLFYSWKYSGKLRVPFRFKPQGIHSPFHSSDDCVTGQWTHFLNQLDDSVSHLQSIALTSFKQIEYCIFVCIVVIIYASKWHWDLMSQQGVWLIQGGKSLLKRKGWFLAGI